MGTVLSWSQFGLVGLVAVTLGPVIGYIFRLLLKSKDNEIERAYKERDAANDENDRLHNRLDDQQRSVLVTLTDVARVMSDVQTMMREREIARRVEDELKHREEGRGGQA